MGQASLIAEAFEACSAVGVPLDRLFEVISAGGANSGIFQMVAGSAKDGNLDEVATITLSYTFFRDAEADAGNRTAALSRAASSVN